VKTQTASKIISKKDLTQNIFDIPFYDFILSNETHLNFDTKKESINKNYDYFGFRARQFINSFHVDNFFEC